MKLHRAATGSVYAGRTAVAVTPHERDLTSNRDTERQDSRSSCQRALREMGPAGAKLLAPELEGSPHRNGNDEQTEQ